MPVIRVDIGTIDAAQKKQLIEELTEAAVKVTHIPKPAFSVIIQEHGDENYGVGGVTLDKVRKART